MRAASALPRRPAVGERVVSERCHVGGARSLPQQSELADVFSRSRLADGLTAPVNDLRRPHPTTNYDVHLVAFVTVPEIASPLAKVCSVASSAGSACTSGAAIGCSPIASTASRACAPALGVRRA